jgi:pyruvate/2-oxoglutarate dehydrogenase complex dihydrolipoamide dehydrogenase (E3) component
MRTDDPDIFAIGDCAEKFSFFTGKPSALRLATIATAEARIAAANLVKNRRKYEGPIGIFGTVIGDMGISVAGLTERAAKEAGFEFFTGEATSPDRHPGSMPDTSQLSVKLIFEQGTGKLLGGEACGGRTVGEMGNILGCLIRSRATVEDIATLQFGTHPALTASPITYPLVNAAEQALTKI